MNEQRCADDYSISVFKALTLLKSRAAYIVLTGIIFGLLGFGGTKLLTTPQYEATATMLVNTRNDVSAAITNDQITSAEKLVDTYAVIITSRSVLEQVIDNLQLDMEYSQLEKKVTVEPVNNTQIIGISVYMSSAEDAEKVLGGILQVAPGVLIDAVEAGSVKTIDEAYSANEPISPNVALNTIVTSVLGLIISCMYIVLRYVFRDTYKDERELGMDLGITVLGAIPKLTQRDTVNMLSERV